MAWSLAGTWRPQRQPYKPSSCILKSRNPGIYAHLCSAECSCVDGCFGLFSVSVEEMVPGSLYLGGANAALGLAKAESQAALSSGSRTLGSTADSGRGKRPWHHPRPECLGPLRLGSRPPWEAAGRVGAGPSCFQPRRRRSLLSAQVPMADDGFVRSSVFRVEMIVEC